MGRGRRPMPRVPTSHWRLSSRPLIFAFRSLNILCNEEERHRPIGGCLVAQ
jgi:hypothetical protein